MTYVGLLISCDDSDRKPSYNPTLKEIFREGGEEGDIEQCPDGP